MIKKNLFSLLVAGLNSDEKASVKRLSNAADPAKKKSQLALLCFNPTLICKKFQSNHLRQLFDILTIHSSLSKWGKTLQQKSMFLKAVILRDRMFLGDETRSFVALDNYITGKSSQIDNVLTVKEVIKYQLKYSDPRPNRCDIERISELHKSLIEQNIENYKAWICYSLTHFIYNSSLRDMAYTFYINQSENISKTDRKVVTYFFELLSPQTLLFQPQEFTSFEGNDGCRLANFVNIWSHWKANPKRIEKELKPDDSNATILVKANVAFLENDFKGCRKILDQLNSGLDLANTIYPYYVVQFVNDEIVDFNLNLKKNFNPYTLHENLDWRLGLILHFISRDNYDSADLAIEAFRKFMSRSDSRLYSKTWKGIIRILLQLKKDAYYYSDVLDDLIEIFRNDWEVHTQHFIDQYISFKTLILHKSFIQTLVPSEIKANTWRSI